jgi:hypothetical protein
MDLKKELGEVANAVSKIMDEALKGNQHKIDANKNGKVDAHDFKLLRAKKEVKEESEQIDELSKATMGSYVKRATNQAIIKSLANPKDDSDDMKTIDKREKGVRLAVSKLTKEDQDFINELNKSTLGSYVNKSAKDAVDRTAQEVETGEIDKVADKRMKGIKLATKKLAKEETDQVEEGYYKNMDTNRKEDERLAAKKKKDTPPFTPDKPKAKVATPGKFGYGYSAARHLARQGMAGVTKEETEQVEEAITKTSTGYIHHARPGVYGGSEKEKHVVDTLRGPKKSEIEAIEKEKKMKKFSEMLDLINTHGLKALSEMIKEEPDNEQFTQELKDQEAKAAGKGKKAEVAKGAVQAVKVEEEVEQLDELSPKTLGSYVKKAHRSGTDNSFDHGEDEHRQYGDPDEDPEREKEMQDRERAIANREKGVHRAVKRLTKEEQIKERSLTEPEMKKKEEIVKSMKKGLSGFKARYGKDAKSVMYATATKQAKGE